MKSRRGFVAGPSVVLLLGALLVVACGGSEEEGDGDGAGDSAQAPAEGASGDEESDHEWVDRRKLNALERIEKATRSASRDIREQALNDIADLEDDRAAIRLLEPMIGDEEPELREVVVAMLTNLDAKSSYMKLRTRLSEEEDPAVRAALVNAIAKLGGSSDAPDLIAIAEDLGEAEPVRVNAIFALGKLQDDVALDALHDLAADLRSSIRRAAIEALGKIASEKSVDAIGDRVADDADPVVRVSGAKTLGTIGSRAGVPYLMRAIETDDPQLQSAVVEALQEITGERFGYDEMKTAEQNAPAVKRWLEWWEDAKD